LDKNKQENEGFEERDFRKAKIATIIACRMKSTRLPKKAILPIGDISSIELCIKHTLQFENVDEVILATSTEDEDAILEKYTYSDEVIFHKGHPDDVIERYLGVAEKRGIDVVVRVTGDMQYISNDIAQILLKSHFETGADYTNAREAAIGANLEIMNVRAMRKIKKYFPSADYSEYMSKPLAKEIATDIKNIKISLESLKVPFVTLAGQLEKMKADIIIPSTNHRITPKYIKYIENLV